MYHHRVFFFFQPPRGWHSPVPFNRLFSSVKPSRHSAREAKTKGLQFPQKVCIHATARPHTLTKTNLRYSSVCKDVFANIVSTPTQTLAQPNRIVWRTLPNK